MSKLKERADKLGVKFGVEIEQIGLSQYDSAYAISGVVDPVASGTVDRSYEDYGTAWQYTANDGRTWKAVEDGSINGDGECTCECYCECTCADNCTCGDPYNDYCTCECTCSEECYCDELDEEDGDECSYCSGDSECNYCEGGGVCVAYCDCGYCLGHEECDFCRGEHECDCRDDCDCEQANAEVVTPILSMDDMETLKAVARKLADEGSYADESCGIHVHVSSPYLTRTAVLRLIKNVRKMEAYIYKSLAVHYNREHSFAKRVDAIRLVGMKDATTAETFKAAWYGRDTYSMDQKYNQTRYFGVNLHSYFRQGTVEFRWFNGSVEADEIEAYVNLCVALVVNAIRSRRASEKIKEYTDTDKDLRDWRVFLNGLDLTGSEYSSTRKVLTRTFTLEKVRRDYHARNAA